VQQPKSVTAAGAAVKINPAMRLRPLQHKVPWLLSCLSPFHTDFCVWTGMLVSFIFAVTER
jgi:hypothetical protein